MGYILHLKTETSGLDTSISMITIQWYSWSKDQYIKSIDDALIQLSISYAEMSIHDTDGNTENTAWGSLPHGTKGTGLVPSVINYTPTKKFVFKKPVVYNTKFSVIFYYATGLQSFTLRIQDVNTNAP